MLLHDKKNISCFRTVNVWLPGLKVSCALITYELSLVQLKGSPPLQFVVHWVHLGFFCLVLVTFFWNYL